MWTFAFLAGRREAAAGDPAVLQCLEGQSPRFAGPFPSLPACTLAACPGRFVLVRAAAPGVYLWDVIFTLYLTHSLSIYGS